MREWLIDANLLVLLVAGLTDEDLIRKHKRLRRFQSADYLRLLVLIDVAHTSRDEDKFTETGAILLTPNTLTEASNLLGQHREPERTRLLDTLKRLIDGSREKVVSSTAAPQTPVFMRLGLTDGALFDVASAERPLLTVDLDLYTAVAGKDHRAAVNFTNVQDLG